MEENKEETPKNKKARSARDRSQGKDKKQDGSKSREAKSLLNTPSPYGTDRPQRERKTVERLVEVIEKETNRNFVVEKVRCLHFVLFHFFISACNSVSDILFYHRDEGLL